MHSTAVFLSEFGWMPDITLILVVIGPLTARYTEPLALWLRVRLGRPEPVDGVPAQRIPAEAEHRSRRRTNRWTSSTQAGRR